MNRVRLVVAVAATFVVASVGFAAGSAGDPMILGADMDPGGTVTHVRGTFTARALGADSLVLEAPLQYHGGSDSTGIVTIPAGATSQTVSFLGTVLPAEEAFMFLEPIQGAGAAQFSTSSRYLPAQDAFRVRINKPAPTGGLWIAYHVVTWGEP